MAETRIRAEKQIMAGPSGSASKRFTLRTNEAQTEPQWQVDDFSAIVDLGGDGHYTTIAAAVSGEPTNARIYIKNGTYPISTNITLKSGQELIGESLIGVELDFQSIADIGISANGNTIRNLAFINGNITAANGSLLRATASNLYELYFDSCSATATSIALTSASLLSVSTSTTVSNIKFTFCSLVGVGDPTLIVASGNDCVIDNINMTNGITSSGNGVLIKVVSGWHSISKVKTKQFIASTGQAVAQINTNASDVNINDWQVHNTVATTETVAGPIIFNIPTSGVVSNIQYCAAGSTITLFNGRANPVVSFGGRILSDSVFRMGGPAPTANTTTAIVNVSAIESKIDNVRVNGQRATTFGRYVGFVVPATIDDVMITNCQAIDCNIGVQIAAATCDRTLVVGNAIRNAVTPISNLGTGSVLSGNQTV